MLRELKHIQYRWWVIIKYEWLKQYQELEEEIYLLRWKIKKSEVELDRWVEGDLVNVKLEKDSLSSKLEKNIEDDKELLDEKEKNMNSLVNMIEKFQGLDNQILKMKYVDRMTLKDISIELNYSYSYIMAKHSQLVKVIKLYESTVEST